jgi:hypothetical protein
MRNPLLYLIAGCILGLALGVMLAQAGDPCDTPYSSYDREHYSFNEPKPDEDAAMQFHWSNHQPSLHPK